MKRYGADFFDEEYFTKDTKSSYGFSNPRGGYTREIYLPFKIEQCAQILDMAGYTFGKKFGKSRLPNNVLVLGCAVGYLVETLQKNAKVDAMGIDISAYAIGRGVNEGIKNLFVGDVCELDKNNIKDNMFELVISMEVLEHIPEDDGQLSKAIDEHIRVTKDFLVVSTPIGKETNEPTISIGKNKNPSHFSLHSPNWWANEFEKRGMKTFQQFESKGVCVIVFEKPCTKTN
ncbi:class I SAM-dependent methyltransferase [Sulfuricurvum sp.]|uniref:class I SAM-dependent methyltransferase n=1 Tax=Sulfuricurvum sp. TaxID=2025608 RepID=UPI003566B02E